jgi:L-methionine (R)-S-oxide reductase
MAEEIFIHSTDKAHQYEELIPQLQALIGDEKNLIANLANASAALQAVFNFLWIGFYLVEGDELVLGPFQGPVACTRIQKGKGVCGQSWLLEQLITVPNVDEFPGHIACSSLSKSEIVIPLIKNNDVVAVLDVDCQHVNHFDVIDDKYLSIRCTGLSTYCF